MKLSLNKFQSVLDERIVSRGEEYFSNEAVSALEQITDGKWAASVEGTETYRVNITLKGNDVRDYFCTCPYDLGPVCKHVVAVLFAIREAKEGGESKKSGHKDNRTDHGVEETFEQAISRMSPRELRATLTDYAARDTNLVDHVFASRVLKAPASGKEQYRRIIRDSINTVRDRHGYVGYWQARHAVGGAEKVLEKAEDFLVSKGPAKALLVFQCVLEEMVPFLQVADDSNGDIGGVIGQAFEGLTKCAAQAKTSAFRGKFFDYLLTECGHKRYEGWSEWRWDFLEIAAGIIKTAEERDRLWTKIDEIEKKHGKEGGWFKYDHERALRIKLSMISRTGTDKEAEEFLNQHLDCTPFREQAIEKAIQKKDYDLAEKLAKEGLEQDQARGLPGLVDRWRKRLLDIAQLRRDPQSIKKYALELFLDLGDLEYYREYKKRFDSCEWPQEAEKVIHLVRRSQNGRGFLSLPHIYIEEKQWPELLAYVEKANNPWTLEEFSKHLVSRYPDEIAGAYEKAAVEVLAPPTGRGNYQVLCRFLGRMRKLGFKDRVQRIISELSEKYKNRPALLEELGM